MAIHRAARLIHLSLIGLALARVLSQRYPEHFKREAIRTLVGAATVWQCCLTRSTAHEYLPRPLLCPLPRLGMTVCAAFAQVLAGWIGVVAAIRIDRLRLLQRSAAHAADRHNEINLGSRFVMSWAFASVKMKVNGDAVGVDCDVLLGASGCEICGGSDLFFARPNRTNR